MKKKKIRAGWFCPSVVDWMETEQLNASSQWIVVAGLSALNGWKNPAYCTFLQKVILIKNYEGFFFLCMDNCSQ